MHVSRCGIVACLVAAAASCGRRTTVEHIAWTAEWQGQPLNCGQTPADPEFHLDDLRFFIHDVRVVNARGAEVPARLIPDGRWQTRDVALIDFAPDCADGRTSHARLDVEVPEGPWTSLHFRLGVPFDLDHANPAVAEGPLSIGAMSWSWQAGYKFLKLEGRRRQVPFRVHLGSTECQGTFTHVTGCGRPNVADIVVPWKAGGVALELSDLIDKTSTDPNGTNCKGDSDPVCAKPFAALALDLHSGRPTGTQRAFRAP